MGVKVADITIEEARKLVSNRLLWPLVRDFLWDFAPQVHPSWLEGMPWREVLNAGRDASSSQVSYFMRSSRVKRFVLDSLGVEPCFHTFPNDDLSRILLLDGATLGSIVKWLGALAYAGVLRRVTDGATVRELKAAFPGVYPEVFGYTMYFGEFVQRSGAETQEWQSAVVKEGCSILQSALSILPPSLVARLKFKFPKESAFASFALGLAPDAKNGRGTSDERRKTAQANILKLLKLKFPEAYKLCCS